MNLPEHQPIHPGAYIREAILKEFNITQEHLAQELHVSRRTINEIINGKRMLTVEMALRIAKYTNTHFETWLNMQAMFDAWRIVHSEKGKSIKAIGTNPTLADAIQLANLSTDRPDLYDYIMHSMTMDENDLRQIDHLISEIEEL